MVYWWFHENDPLNLKCPPVSVLTLLPGLILLSSFLSLRPSEGGLAAAGGASDPWGDVGCGGAKRLAGVPAGGAENAGETGKPGWVQTLDIHMTFTWTLSLISLLGITVLDEPPVHGPFGNRIWKDFIRTSPKRCGECACLTLETSQVQTLIFLHGVLLFYLCVLRLSPPVAPSYH